MTVLRSIARLRLPLLWAMVLLGTSPVTWAAQECYERMFEHSFESPKVYADPFNDVEIDAIFTQGRRVWRVPAFWRGGQRWTVRFAPPVTGSFSYRLESSDPND